MKMGSQAPAKTDQMSKLIDLMSHPDKARAQLTELQQANEYHKKVIREADEKKETARQAMEALDVRATAVANDLAAREAAAAEREEKVTQAEIKIKEKTSLFSFDRSRFEAEKLDFETNIGRVKSQIEEYRQTNEKELEAIRQRNADEYMGNIENLTTQTSELASQRKALDARAEDLAAREKEITRQEQDLRKLKWQFEQAARAVKDTL
jgi:chromosome segregation ATPase